MYARDEDENGDLFLPGRLLRFQGVLEDRCKQGSVIGSGK